MTEDIDWLQSVREVCAPFTGINLTIGEPRTFGSAILYLSTESEEVIDLHKRLVEAIAPTKEESERYFELERYLAHMTLAQTSWGFSEADLVKLKACAEQELSPFPTFKVNFIRIYKESDSGRYEPFLDIPFEG